MLKFDVQRAQEAVQYLVDSSYEKHHVKRLRNVVQRPRSLPFRGEAEVLNELLVVGRQNLRAMENLIAVAEFKRSAKTPYMKAFMQAKRERDRKVVQIEEVTNNRKLTLDERVALLRATHEKWNTERSRHLQGCAQQYREQCGKEPEWAHSNAFIKDFWMHKDMELDVLLRKAKEFASHRHQPKKEFVPVRPQRVPRNPVMADKLRKILEQNTKK